MDDKKNDRRVKYTKMVIRNSLIKFMKEKPITKITVKELCDDADINRATFYAHYQDQYDLLHQVEEDIIENIHQQLSGYDFQNSDLVQLEMIENILVYIEDNAELFAILLNNSNGDMNFQQEVIKIIGEQHFIPILGKDTFSIEDAEYIFHFLASGSVGIIQMWLAGNMKKSAKEIAQLILKAAANGRSSFL
jgi:hypothetical protein